MDSKKLNYEYKEDQLHLSDIGMKRTVDQLPDVVTTYQEEYVNPTTGEVQIVTVRVFPNEPSPLENLRPAYAYGAS